MTGALIALLFLAIPVVFGLFAWALHKMDN